MDDLQFRRNIYADPSSTDPEVIAARKADPAKQQFAEELVKLDQQIYQAMNIDVPDDLYNKLMLRQTLVSHQQQKRKNRIQLAMAASVAFAVGLSVNFAQSSNTYSDLGDYAIAHVNHEAHLFNNNSNAQVSLASLNKEMSTYHASFTQSLGKLISAGECNFGGIKVLHLVYQGKTQPVTVFVVPPKSGLNFDASFSNGDLHGQAQQFKNANVIVVGDKNEQLQQWQQKIDTNITWSI
ncbi:MAG: DUF3379 domain-containing protein [Alteromonadaceae bacterium]|nr:DUF3379 domain-containing protein [Alteromonadaceae bacterium]PCI63327.1 MAG: hypothetical protein COB35_01610 [Gammaproteobacteria bacterium]